MTDDTLPQWLYQRFTHNFTTWENLHADDQLYWEHEAAAVRRAVERGGFKQPTVTICELPHQSVEEEDACERQRIKSADVTETNVVWMTSEAVPVQSMPRPSRPCQTTQHCASHGWCRRCAPAFAAVMSAVNVAIQRTDADQSHWGPLYEAVATALRDALMPATEAETPADPRPRKKGWGGLSE